MKFIVAPDWFMALPDKHLLKLKEVTKLYEIAGKESADDLILREAIPPPDYITGKRKEWSVGHLKDYLKLPTELREPDAELLDYYCGELAKSSNVRKHTGSRY